PPDEAIRHIYLVPFIGDQYVLVRLQNGRWDIPGRALAPGESYMETLRREMREEVGARLLWMAPLGILRCRPLTDEQNDVAAPADEETHLVGFGEVEIVLQPETAWVEDQATVMECLPVERACRRFEAAGRPHLAALYRLAAQALDERCP
ncbi:MAG: NUDIX domain-containing protein, partial [Chloroflexi bacterium]|nr:NUDIX domain-containing protein [Chloroflexota bacterium]